MICETCMQVHGRDTNAPIQCPVCRQIVGCFWHNRGSRHVRDCERRQAGLPPLPRWDDGVELKKVPKNKRPD